MFHALFFVPHTFVIEGLEMHLLSLINRLAETLGNRVLPIVIMKSTIYAKCTDVSKLANKVNPYACIHYVLSSMLSQLRDGVRRQNCVSVDVNLH